MPTPDVPNPKSADYQRKDSLTTQLAATGGDPIASSAVLFDLGTALTANALLSHKQRENLLATLMNTGLIIYQQSYFAAIEGAQGDDNTSEIEGRLEASLDPAHWDIERNGTLQASAIAAAAQLSHPGLTVSRRVEVVASVFNNAQLATTSARDGSWATPFSDKRFQNSTAKLEKTEEEVFLQRGTLAVELADFGLVMPEDVEALGDIAVDDFKSLRSQSAICDLLIALHFVKKSKAANVVEVFGELQEVLHAGYTTGALDANEANQRYDEER